MSDEEEDTIFLDDIHPQTVQVNPQKNLHSIGENIDIETNPKPSTRKRQRKSTSSITQSAELKKEEIRQTKRSGKTNTSKRLALSKEEIAAIQNVMIYDTTKIVQLVLERSGSNLQFSKYFLRRMTELSLSVVEILAKDGEQNAQHAKRNTLISDDIFLALRHSPHRFHLAEFAQTQGIKLSPKTLEAILSEQHKTQNEEETHKN